MHVAGAARRARTGPWRLLALVLVAGSTLVSARAARADCEDCPGPTWAELRAQPGFELLIRRGAWGAELDYVETDGGECRVVLDDVPTVHKTGSWLVLRAAGEVWTCPHSTSTDRIAIETREGDSTAWSVTGTLGAEADLIVASVQSRLEAGLTRGETITEVTRVEKTIRAAWCRRIPWEGYFEIARYEASASGRIERRFAWWTKNANTGALVHAHGEMQVTCHAGTIVLWRRAPIAGWFHLRERPCNDPACADVTARDLGWFPDPPPPPPYAPVVTPRGEEGAAHLPPGEQEEGVGGLGAPSSSPDAASPPDPDGE